MRAAIAGLAMAGGLALAATLLAVGFALRLDTPVGAGPRDPAPIQAGRAQVQVPEGIGELPPLAPGLERPLPRSVEGLTTVGDQLAELSRLARSGDPSRLVQLGAAQLRVGDSPAATASFDRALARAPRSVEAQIGAAFAEAVSARDLDGAAARIEQILTQSPRSQVAHFNRGWLATYRRDRPTVIEAWKTTVALGPRTQLGRTATQLLTPLGETPSRATP